MKHSHLTRTVAVALPLLLGTPLLDCNPAPTPKPKVDVPFKTSIPELQEIPAKGSVVVQLSAKWCAPCHELMRNVMDSLHSGEPGIQVFKLDIDKNRILADKLMGENDYPVPVVLLFKDGKEVGRLIGYSGSLIDMKVLLRDKGLL